MQRAEATGETRPDRRGWRMQIFNMYAVLTLITVSIRVQPISPVVFARFISNCRLSNITDAS